LFLEQLVSGQVSFLTVFIRKPSAKKRHPCSICLTEN
jgi:hypothetical protein